MSYATALAFAYTLGAVLGLYNLHAFDLGSIWSGPRALMLGHDVYDPSTWGGVVAATGLPPVSPIYVYPPWTLLALAPLGLLSFETARAVWTVGGAVAAAVAVGALVRHLQPGAVAAAAAGVAMALSAPAITAVFNAQWSFLLTAALAAAVLAARANAWGGALAVLLLVLKPQLAVLAGPGILVYAWLLGSRRFVVASLAAIALLLVASVLIFPVGTAEWFRTIPPFIAMNELHDATVAGALGADSSGETTAISVAVLAIGVAALYALARRADWFPTCLAASIALAPHARSYDQLLLVVPLLLAASSLNARARAFALAGLAVLIVGSLVLYAIALVRADETWSVATALLCTIAVATAAVADGRRASTVPD